MITRDVIAAAVYSVWMGDRGTFDAAPTAERAHVRTVADAVLRRLREVGLTVEEGASVHDIYKGREKPSYDPAASCWLCGWVHHFKEPCGPTSGQPTGLLAAAVSLPVEEQQP